MSLVTGKALISDHFFSAGSAKARGSSFDLTIGAIYDHEGKLATGPVTIKPGELLQVISAEVFNLPDTVTGHVTYKTALTKIGIWALTVGIVDPGWHGPVTTTLLNFSRVDHAIAPGDTFLRVSFFNHDAVPSAVLSKPPNFNDYVLDVQRTAMTKFPQTFLDKEQIKEITVAAVLKRVQKLAIVWVTLIAFIFAMIQLAGDYLHPDSAASPGAETRGLQDQINNLELRMNGYESRQQDKSNPVVPTGPAKTR